jgi:hypothetical protein
VFPYVKQKTDATFVMLGTATPAPADAGLNPDDKGEKFGVGMSL